MRIKTKAVSNLKSDLVSFSTHLRELQLAISDAEHTLRHHMLINTSGLKMVEAGLGKLDALRLQLISLSSVGTKTYKLLERDEPLIHSLRSMKTTLNPDGDSVHPTSRSYIKSRNLVLSLLKQNLSNYLQADQDDEDEDVDRSLGERLKDWLLSSPISLVDAYCEFFFEIKERVESYPKRSGSRKGGYVAEVDRDHEVMEGLYDLSLVYKDTLLKNLTSIEELMGMIKGVHMTELQFDLPLIETMSMFTLSGILGIALAVRELEGRY